MRDTFGLASIGSITCWLPIACLALLATTAASADTVLVKDGQPGATIVLPADATETEKLAAEELAGHVEKMSGARLTTIQANEYDIKGVVICIGRAAQGEEVAKFRTAGGDPASFRIIVTDNSVQLAGLSDDGALFATCALLEQLGVRWFCPGEFGAVIPETKTVAVKQQDTVQHPGFSGRHLQAISAGTKEQAQSASAWARRMRMGGFDAGAHGLGARADRTKEPELFMSENGRTTHQMKVSNPEVLRRVVEVWRAALAKNPERAYLPIGPEDGAGFGSDPWDANDVDPFYGNKSVTDRYVKFFNLVLEDIQKDYPDVGLSFYCYSCYMRPPVREKPNAKILPVLAPIDVCRFHAIDNPLCWERQYIKQVVDGWKALGLKMMYRGYLFNLADQGLPFSMLRQIRAEYPYYYEQGMIACRVECIPAWSYHGPSLYLAAKIMWDPKLDVEALLQDYFTKFYGPAAAPMRAHFDRLEDAYEHTDCHTGNVFDIPHILTPEVMAELDKSLKEAEGLAPEGSPYAKRVNMTRQGYEFGRANLAMMAAFNAFDFAEAKKNLDVIQGEIIPKAIAHDPPLLSPRAAVGYTKRFWAGSVQSGFERVTGGNEIIARLPDEWMTMLDPWDAGEAVGLWKPELGVGSWQPLKTYSQSWSNQGLRYYKGEMWYRTTAEAPAKYKGRKIRLWLGGVDDTPKAWINGRELPVLAKGAAPTGRPWEFDATDAVAFDKANVITIKVTNRAVHELGTGGLTGPAMLWAEKP